MTDRQQYLEGRCHVLAIALQRVLGSGFLLLVDKDSPYASGLPAVHHVYARFGDGLLIDILGMSSETDVVAQWEDGGSGMTSVELSEEEELADYAGDGLDVPLDAYDEADVDRAMDDFRTAHAANPRLAALFSSTDPSPVRG